MLHIKIKGWCETKGVYLRLPFCRVSNKKENGLQCWILEKDSTFQHTGIWRFWLCKMLEIVFQNGILFLMENCILKIMNRWLHTNEDSKETILPIQQIFTEQMLWFRRDSKCRGCMAKHGESTSCKHNELAGRTVDIRQARGHVAISFSRGSPQSRNQSQVSCSVGGFFTRKAH